MTFTAAGIALSVETKATTDNNWEGVQQVAVLVDGAVKPYDVEASADDNYKSATLSSSDPFYWQSTEPIAVAAWWPYTEGSTTMPTVTVQTDQSDRTNYDASDYIHAENTAMPFDGPHALQFTHRTAKVVINPLKNGEGVGADELKGATLTLTSVATTEGGEATATVTPYYDATTGTWTALLPTQTPTADEPFILISLGEVTYSYSPDKAVTLTGGNQYTLTVKRPKVEGTASISTWGPTTPVEGVAEPVTHTYDASTNTYTVYTAAGLDAWAADVRNNQNWDANCILANNIDYGGKTWGGTGTSPYTGTFDGGGNTLSNMVIPVNQISQISGLVENLKGTVQNLVLDGVELQTATTYHGLIAGYNNNGTIAGCTVLSSCKIICNSSGYTGGIAGYNVNNGQITRCHAECRFEGSNSSNHIGGIAGTNRSSITASSYKGSCNVNGNATVGSLIGRFYGGAATACWTSVKLVSSVTMTGMVGSWPSSSPPTLTACYWEGDGITDNGTGTQVTGGNWTEAINDMNTEFGADFGWHYVAGGDGLPTLVPNE